ncbi:MAG: hypothetical protein QOD74_109 [Variibacter sp.]|jgi:murein DD-endopeptidase MepM/ murein hydrolase activator NlpD|nr:hypothetical protein [Variibacter sp.]
MNDNPFRGFASTASAPPTDMTGSVQTADASAPVSRVETQPLGADPLPAPPHTYRSGTGATPARVATAPAAPATPAYRSTAQNAQPAEKPKAVAAPAAQKPSAAATPATTAKSAAAPAQTDAKQTNVKVASLQPTVPAARIATPTVESASDASGPSVTGAMPTFRWPVRGRVIAGYGAKTNGQQNDGINIAVPEGTSVKASEDGVVAYAGNELKGYGNLVLVKHSNGFVTAYAHASEVTVKRGDTVKRGQIIAKAGQTGSVSSPQLHFEIRKGSSPVDPSQHLSGS